MESFEKILNNCDILETIFRYLDFREHLKLIKICAQFEYAIFHGVWRLNCKNYYILEMHKDEFFLKYSLENNFEKSFRGITLKPEVIDRILHHFSKYIHKLELKDIRCFENIISFNYHHLTELKLCGIFVKDNHLQQVAENCRNLQSFSLKEFSIGANLSNIQANVFDSMKALNKLEITAVCLNAWNYFDVQQLFCHPHLKTLIINIDILDSKDDNKESNYNSTDRVYNIENLTIGALPCLQSRNICFIEDLKRFENLTKLSLTSNIFLKLSLDDNDLAQINNACPKLCELSFDGYYFRFKEFPRMNNLQHLLFKECKNIGLEHYGEIFRKLQLKSLSIVSVEDSARVKAENILDYNYISRTLETLTIRDGFNRNTISTFFNRQQHKFENASKITLEMGSSSLAGSTELCFSHNFPNLQELIMDFFYIASEDILHLKYLKVLQFDIFYGMSWSYLEILFKHPTLTHITITPCNWEDYEYILLPKSCEGLTSTLEYLSLPSVVYGSVLNFWPTFQLMNKLMKLEIVECFKVKE